MEGNSGGNDVELLCKTLQVEHKLFYFDLKENPRGRYLKISEKTSVNRSTIIVPVNGISWFLDLFNYYVNSDEQDAFSKELQLDTKVFYFDIGENRRGRFLKVAEASVNRNRSTIIVPAGSARDEGWAAFRNILAEINEACGLFILPNQQNSEPSEHLVGLSDDVGAGFISGHSTQPPPASDLNVDRSVELPSQDEIGSLGVSKVIRADQKRFFFDLGSNNRGHFLRISEVAGADRSSIILPLSGLKQFHEMVGHFVEITKDRVEAMTGANVRTVETPRDEFDDFGFGEASSRVLQSMSNLFYPFEYWCVRFNCLISYFSHSSLFENNPISWVDRWRNFGCLSSLFPTK